MTIASAQASAFYKEAAKRGRLFTLLADGSFLVWRVRDIEAVPFWSTRSRVEKVQAMHPKLVSYAIDEIPLASFLSKTLVQLEEDNVHIGVNWSGRRLTGYDVSCADLRTNLGYWESRVDK